MGDVLPEFAEEVTLLLRAAGEPELAASFKELPVLARCGCGQSSCGSFRTAELGYDYDYTLGLDVTSGKVGVDLDTDGRLVYVEVLDRGDVGDALTAAGSERDG